MKNTYALATGGQGYGTPMPWQSEVTAIQW